MKNKNKIKIKIENENLNKNNHSQNRPITYELRTNLSYHKNKD
jgi:hypothetical protein